MSYETGARLLLVGQGPTAATALRSLLQQHQVLGVVRSAAPEDPVALTAGAAGVPVYPDTTVDGITEVVAGLRPDCVVVSSYDRILPAELLRSCPFVNVHYSPLPAYRGRANVNWAVINGESEVAISVHELVPDLDAGGVLFQQRVPIGPRSTATELYAQLNGLQEGHLAAAVERLLGGDHGLAQDESLATYGCTRVPEDGELDWQQETVVLDRLVRGLTSPAPGAFTYLGLERVRVDVAEPSPDVRRFVGRVPGRVVQVSRRHGWVDVLTGDGALRLHSVRDEAGVPHPAAELIRSVRSTLGLRTQTLLQEIVELRRQLRAATVSSPRHL